MVDKLVNSEMNTKRIANVEYCFGISGIPLSVAGRVLVGEGVLTKICKKKPKSRQFFLFNDILVYGTILINKKKYASQKIIPLESLTIEDLPDEAVMKNGWLIKTQSKSFAVYAGSPSEKAEWIRHIKKCANDLLEQTGYKAPPTEHAAVWVPDSIAKKCMHCNETQFTTFNRRHHCRRCGSVVCGGCSKNRIIILAQSNKPVRVCETCYEKSTNHLNRSKKSSINSVLNSPTPQQLIDRHVEQWVSLASEQMNERLKETGPTESVIDSNSDDQDEPPIYKAVEAVKLDDQTIESEHKEGDDVKLNGSKDSNPNDETSESEDELLSSVEDFLEAEHKKPTFYNMSKSKDGQLNDATDLTNGNSNAEVEVQKILDEILKGSAEKSTKSSNKSNNQADEIRIDHTADVDKQDVVKIQEIKKDEEKDIQNDFQKDELKGHEDTKKSTFDEKKISKESNEMLDEDKTKF